MTSRSLITVGVTVVLGWSGLLGCTTDDPPPREPAAISVRLGPQDFRSDFGSGGDDSSGPDEWRGALAVAWIGSLGHDLELPRRATEIIGRGVYLVELASGEQVPGEVREGVVRLDGEVVPGWPDGGISALGVVSFVPSEPLDDGWYVLVADLREWMAMEPSVPTHLDDTYGLVEDDVIFARIRVGSAPVWYLSGIDCGTRPRGERTTWCDAWAVFSEPVDSLGATRFELRVDGELASDCVERQSSTGVGWECPYYPEDTEFEIRLVESDVVRPLDGVTSQTIVGGGPYYPPHPLVSPRFGIDVARSAR